MNIYAMLPIHFLSLFLWLFWSNCLFLQDLQLRKQQNIKMWVVIVITRVPGTGKTSEEYDEVII